MVNNIRMKTAWQMAALTELAILAKVQEECSEIEEMLIEAAKEGKNSCEVNLAVFHMETKRQLTKLGYLVTILGDHPAEAKEIFDQNILIEWKSTPNW